MQRQTQVLRYFFLLYGTACGGAAAWTAIREPLTAAAMAALACAVLPLFLLSQKDFVVLRRALSWTIPGTALLALGVIRQDRGAWRVEIAAAAMVTLAILIRDAVRTGPGPLDGFTLFSAPPAPASLRDAYEEEIRQAAGQEERNRMARELHDSIKQQIFAIQTSAAAAEARFDTDGPGARAALANVRSSAREAMVEMEAMLDQLRATPLETVGLVEALKKQCEALEFRTGARVTVNVADIAAPERMRPGLAQSLFRIAQEALANIARHARASKVTLSLAGAGADITLTIEDNGSGFAPDAAPRTGMGLANIKARAAEMGGLVELESSPGKGTRVAVRLPLSEPAPQAVDEKTMRAFWVLVALAASALVIAPFVKTTFPVGFAAGIGIGIIALGLKIFLGKRIA
jgi:signal transduction histidine kinase